MNTIGFSLGIALLTLGTGFPAQGGSTGILEDILLAEDRRARETGDLALLTRALGHGDALVVRRAARALGRLERPELVPHLFPLLQSPLPAVRSTAAEAIAQAAQGLRRDASPEFRGKTWPALLAALRDRLPEESDPDVRGMLALSLGRLPYVDTAEIAAVRRALVDLCSGVRGGGEANTRYCRGAETLVRSSARRVPLEPDERRGLGDAVRLGRGAAPRRHALGALIAAPPVDDSVLATALRAEDAELRRLGLTGLRPADAAEPPLLLRALGDSVPAVRLEALRALSRVAGERGCPRLNRATQDPAAMVSLMAIDLLGTCGRDETAVLRLMSLAGRVRYPSASPPARPSTWHYPAHALVALARADPGRAALPIQEAAVHRIWQIRLYAARAAALVRDSASLVLLGEDVAPNVREAAIAGLGTVAGLRRDDLFRQALRSSDFQLVRTAARVLAGTPARGDAARALLEAFGNMSSTRAMTARDTRVEILNRLRETGDATLATRLEPSLGDYDPVVADSVSAVLHAWTGRRTAPAPVLSQELQPLRLAEVDALRGARLIVQMERGSFEIALLTEEAPATVARIARLVRSQYYTDLTFHRVAPNFVVQGGGPGANEYSGTPDYLRDELSVLSHARGTLGISTRGRDTGDGQLFINLRDNPRLDYDYTVWGRVVAGMGVVDAMQEGDRIRRIDIRPAR